MKIIKRVKRSLYFSFTALYLAGASYWLTHTWFRQRTPFGDEASPLEKWLGPIHLIAALGFIFLLGLIWDHHIRPALRGGKHRISGWVLVTAITALALSGTCMLYGSESWIQLASTYHPWVGLSLLPVLLIHRWKRAATERLSKPRRRS